MTAKPLIALPACRMTADGLTFHTIGDKYVRAVAEAADALPVMLPSLADAVDPTEILARVDGIVLTGSPSNVHPEAYGAAAHEKAEPYDVARDATTLPLIRAAVARGVPLLAICRGMQELNVAFGGTLYARVHEVPGRHDHRKPEGDLDTRYGPKHRIALTPGGVLARLVGGEELWVNSLHWQGVAEPARTLAVEATAEDGTIEAMSLPDARGFVLGVQWHPEYEAAANPTSRAILGAFGEAARQYRAGLVRESV
ncbi:gamma-glutamyl-gamma-aminobutyrate hydrolase [Limimonas halophila]|uniref:gamma-glutamyl-gamma-aminobutyrate hydrolase n=1 Tax=Limimonas halophila TaxID=1082479 RepID=A0A1G7SP11_9PROT|nr:gamma-glutamyl-gamma-aminobutyrate hydrolase family protein [Limimonas halophila]SDG24806.1 gamma-glutamyl-gamma-aminobutyrate hydrolase [Limimonas halophila]